MAADPKKRFALRFDPAAIAALVVIAAAALAVNVVLAWAVWPRVTAAHLALIHVVDFAVSAAALVLALAIAWRVFRPRRLESERWITVCAWTRRVKLQGRWVSFEEFLSRQYHVHCTHGISEEAAREIEREAAAEHPPMAGLPKA